ncbi:hypothetical protein OAS39_01995 [Pirellulales bacterium]|nr:hypothetical protein [Pirellulales bacterium]
MGSLAANRRNATRRALTSSVACGFIVSAALSASAVTHESPEVLDLVEKGLAYLDGKTDKRLGGKCLIALAYKKGGRARNDPQIVAAVEACKSHLGEMRAGRSVDAQSIYSKALAVILLSELDAGAHRELINNYATLMYQHRKPHGGFGYLAEADGDTSQTQYAALASWELLQTGNSPNAGMVEACANWLLRTQGIDGVWGYRGRDPGKFERRTQTRTSPGMLAAGLSSVLICSDMLGILKPGGGTGDQTSGASELPPELRPVESQKKRNVPRLSGSGIVDIELVVKSWADGRAWFDANFSIDNKSYYSYYYLYSLERYKSFEEHLEGDAPDEPEWYNKGFEYIKKTEREEGGWSSLGDSGAVCDTAFAVLFLLRSTKGSLGNLGEGTLIGGRGLPRDLNKVTLKNGKLVVEATPTAVDELLEMIDEGGGAALSALLDNPAALQVTNVGPDEARRLQQIVRSGDAAERLLAVRALSRLRELDYAPTLIFAMSDPDPRIVREARDGLRFVSRRVNGYGLSDDFKDRERYQVMDKWKQWYRFARPDASPLP